MRFSDETLMAFADGELSEAEAEEVEKALAVDPVLAKRVQQFRNVRKALRATYDSVAKEPIPERLRALLGDVAAGEPSPTLATPSAPAADLASVLAQKRAAPSQRFKPPFWGALAAGLLAGLLVGRFLTPTPQALLISENEQLRAGAALARVLNTSVSGETAAGADLQVGMSFRAQDGRYCRTFESMRASQAISGLISGLACREPDAWVVRVATTEAAASGSHQQAAAPAVMDMVDAIIAGEPLTADQERAARDHAWRN